MVGLDRLLLGGGHLRASRALGLGAMTFGVIQGTLSLASMSSLVYLYAPVWVMLMAGAAFIPTHSRFAAFPEESPFTMTLILTIVSGLSALLFVLLFAAIFLGVGRQRPPIAETSGP